ncbi:sialidase family protein [Sediminibacterium sp. KACHI17]|uniref:sialidase family protein n=1 Tax=Sediminibacterium sp. KACHI17 TaxID=1751071 RepID=UPI00336579B9
MRLLSLFLLCCCSFSSQASDSLSVVFKSGEAGYHTFRIPAIIRAPDQSLLAFCEGRVNNAGDYGTIKIVMRRSMDAGKTWSPIQVVAAMGNLQVGNPAPVVDQTDPAFPKGRIFLFYNTGDHHENEVRKGNGLREVWYITSTDNGLNWSAPVNITTQVHRPLQSNRNSSYQFQEDWRSYANTPGHAIQFQQGRYRGRIFIAANHSAGAPQNQFEDYTAHGFYSDDHGKTFRLTSSLTIKGSNESIATELSNGNLMMNSRNQKGDIRARIISISSDGGQNWDTSYFDTQLPDPVNQASLLTIGRKKGKAILAFSNAASTTRRDSLTLRISWDEGKTWPYQQLIDAAPDQTKNDYTAYSDLVYIHKNSIGILYERKGYKEIVFKRIQWK